MLRGICSNSINSVMQMVKQSLENNVENSNLYIFGAGHIGQALSSKSLDLNFNVHLIDSRKNFLLMNEYKDIDYILAKEPWKLIKNLSTEIILYYINSQP